MIRGDGIRARLRRQKALKLATGKQVGKAYTPEEKDRLLAEAMAARSRVIYPALMLALNAGMAHRDRSRENPGRTLQTTALLNEAYIKLVDATGVNWQDRAHFFAVSARIMRRIMRRILVDAARARGSDKRGGGAISLEINDSIDGIAAPGQGLVALDDALDALARFDARKAKVVELRFFGGLSLKDIAEALNVSPQTVMRDWKLARA